MTKMRTISEYKDMALESLSDNWGQGALVTFVYLLTYCGIIGSSDKSCDFVIMQIEKS